MTAYYNEIDPHAAAWLRNLIDAGHIAPGIVDERSIEDVRPNELTGFTQCHFFAGVGVWSHSLRAAGWSDDRPVWTGSCPCQPFSAAGKGGGFDDERHLWPAFQHLIKECRPAVVFGEQVSAAVKHGWWDLVADDAEAIGYSAAGIIFPSSAVGAPHIRERFYFVLRNAYDSKDLFKVQATEATGPIFSKQKVGRQVALRLQGMPKGVEVGVLETAKPGGDYSPQGAKEEFCVSRARLLTPTQNDLSGEGAGLSGKAEGYQEGGSVQPGSACESIAGPDRCGILRTDGHAVSPGPIAELRQPIAGPDRAGTWVHVCQRESCLLCDELRAGNMGRSAIASANGCMEEEKGSLKNDAIDAIQAHRKDNRDAEGEKDFDDSCVGAPHIRDRAYWAGHAGGTGSQGRKQPRQRDDAQRQAAQRDGAACGLADTQDLGRQGQLLRAGPGVQANGASQDGIACGLADTNSAKREAWGGDGLGAGEQASEFACSGSYMRPGPTNGLWADADWLFCRDGKWRPVEPGTFPLVTGATSRVVRLRAYGNAINAKAAQAFIEVVMEAT
jgi:site-specific DNA-cytosine methylase